MASYSTNEFRGGLKVMLDGDPCSIVDNEFVKPGKGQAFNRVKLRNLKTGRVWERTFKSGESLEGADVMDRDMEYLYSDGEFWHFMVGMAFVGLGMGMAAPGFVAASSMAVDPKEQGAVAGLTSAGPALGFIVGPLAGATLYQVASFLPYVVTTVLFLPLLAFAFIRIKNL